MVELFTGLLLGIWNMHCLMTKYFILAWSTCSFVCQDFSLSAHKGFIESKTFLSLCHSAFCFFCQSIASLCASFRHLFKFCLCNLLQLKPDCIAALTRVFTVRIGNYDMLWLFLSSFLINRHNYSLLEVKQCCVWLYLCAFHWLLVALVAEDSTLERCCKVEAEDWVL